MCLLAGTAHPAGPAATDARNLAANCTPCHSADTPEPSAIPRIAGLPAAKILHRLQAFRTGEAPATVMHQIVRGYSDQELALIANHLAIPAVPAADKR
ncbi:Putative cytochrome c [Aromatoleum petrolei]|nr:cytochrome C [Aromatoleum petrolei]QTQ35282.1 Putative cytochrome c [Aromatoleum petrolei]